VVAVVAVAAVVVVAAAPVVVAAAAVAVVAAVQAGLRWGCYRSCLGFHCWHTPLSQRLPLSRSLRLW